MEKILTNIKERVLQIPESKGIAKEIFFKEIGVTYGNFKGKSKNSSLSADVLAKISSIYTDISAEWLLTGNGTMLVSAANDRNKELKFIPVYDSIIVSGRNKLLTDDVPSVMTEPVEYINAGDWFKDADAAMRIHGDSMEPDYYSGSIIPLKQVHNLRLILYGSDYVIETEEYRVLKRLQKGYSTGFIKAHSINKKHWEDGSLMFEPFEIDLKDIKRLFFVLGSVYRNHSVQVANKNYYKK